MIKSEDGVRGIVLLKLSTVRHEASRGLSATAELLVKQLIVTRRDRRAHCQPDFSPARSLIRHFSSSLFPPADYGWHTRDMRLIDETRL